VDEIKEILDEEEESFSRTLDRGEKLFDQFATRAQEQGVRQLNGKDVWRLYDTFGFPVDLTRLMAEELGLGINDAEFDAAQAWSKEASKASLKRDTTDTVKLDVHDIAALERNVGVPKTDDSPKFGKISASSSCARLTAFPQRLEIPLRLSSRSSTTKRLWNQLLTSLKTQTSA
jgi:alanyl-tRNA synthetase